MKNFLTNLPPLLAAISKAFFLAIIEQMQEVARKLQSFLRYLARLLRRSAKWLYAIYEGFETEFLGVIVDLGLLVWAIRQLFVFLVIGIVLYLIHWSIAIIYLMSLGIAILYFLLRGIKIMIDQEKGHYEQLRDKFVQILRLPFRILASILVLLLYYISWQFVEWNSLGFSWPQKQTAEVSKDKEIRKAEEPQKAERARIEQRFLGKWYYLNRTDGRPAMLQISPQGDGLICQYQSGERLEYLSGQLQADNRLRLINTRQSVISRGDFSEEAWLKLGNDDTILFASFTPDGPIFVISRREISSEGNSETTVDTSNFYEEKEQSESSSEDSASNQLSLESAKEQERLFTIYKEEGDTLFNQGSYSEAKSKYLLALSQRPEYSDSEDFANRIKECDQRIAAKQVKSEQNLQVDEGLPPPEHVLYDQGPKVVKEVSPIYPQAARKARLEGDVRVKIWVGKDGKPKKVVIQKSDNEIFNRAAIEAANQFTYKPAMYQNNPVDVWASIAFHFRFRKAYRRR
ncbi:hypothetical protein DCC62_10910 [candidate division KSB1 bacterium]|nr:MAG: hypothetical protein DCC62_10910 [candidate division KSB1 bacterium]